MRREISMADMEELMVEKLKLGGKVRFTPTGISMLPMLRDRKDAVVLEPLSHEPEKYEIFLYKRKNGAFVLHRMIGKNEKGLIFRGDHQYRDEMGICPEDIIGIVTGFTRKGKSYQMEDMIYQIYARVWVNSVSLRHFCQRSKNWIIRRIRRRDQ